MIKLNLAVLLAERGVKISELAKHTGISRTTLTALYYNQSKGIQFETLDTLCEYLKVKPNEIMVHESFSFDFELLTDNTKLDDYENYIERVELAYKINYEGNNIRGVLNINCEVESEIELDPDTQQKVVSSTYVTGEYEQNVRDLLKSLPQLVRTDFDKSLKDEIRFFYSVAFVFTSDSDIYLNIS